MDAKLRIKSKHLKMELKIYKEH